MSDAERPFRILGWHLKLVREQLKQTMTEVSGAVEIDSQLLEIIEQGQQRPSEEILALLISYFDIAELEANSLWELAGYSDSTANAENQKNDLPNDRPIIMALSLDSRVVYTDQAQINANESGVVINFLQDQSSTSQSTSQSLPVARVGMSKEQAKRVLELLQRALVPTQLSAKKIKLLPRHSVKRTDVTDKNS